jgi:hypothetical protein
LQALARSIGPLSASFGKIHLFLYIIDVKILFLTVAYWSIGEKTTYIFGSILLLCPLFILITVQHRLKQIRPTLTGNTGKIKVG